MIACTLTLFIATTLPQNRADIEVTVENQDTYCSIQARDYPVHRLMERLCEKLGGRELRGFEDVEDSPLISVYLDHRPVGQAVDYILGSAGMIGTVTTRAITSGGGRWWTSCASSCRASSLTATSRT